MQRAINSRRIAKNASRRRKQKKMASLRSIWTPCRMVAIFSWHEKQKGREL